MICCRCSLLSFHIILLPNFIFNIFPKEFKISNARTVSHGEQEKEPEDVSVGRVRFEDALNLGASTQDQAVCQLRCDFIYLNLQKDRKNKKKSYYPELRMESCIII
jgi:hypothetical protein